jgi:hypothetical protein
MVADIASHLAYYEKYIFSFSSNIIYLANANGSAGWLLHQNQSLRIRTVYRSLYFFVSGSSPVCLLPLEADRG